MRRRPSISLSRMRIIPSSYRELSRRSLAGSPLRCGNHSDDYEGHWKHSLQWWGTQARGWGSNRGSLLFARPSRHGNGVVSVTAHPALSPASKAEMKDERYLLEKAPDFEVLGYEWRVLRFNKATRQSVAKVLLCRNKAKQDEVILLQKPNCLAFECRWLADTKSLVSVGLAAANFAGLNVELVARGSRHMRILCIGMGGGSLPLFLANKLQGCSVEVVEIDGAVIEAAISAMGFPHCKGSSHPEAHLSRSLVSLMGDTPERIVLFEAEGAAFVSDVLQRRPKNYYDLVYVDAVDGNDKMPFHLWDSNGAFLRDLGNLLHPLHGTVVVNLHSDMPPPSLLERVSRRFSPGFDPSLPGGKQIQEICQAYRNVLLPTVQGGEDSGCSKALGLVFTVAVPCQQNIALVISRGICQSLVVAETLAKIGTHLEHALNIPFNVAHRITRGFHLV